MKISQSDILSNIEDSLYYKDGCLFWKKSRGSKKEGDLAGYNHPDGAKRVRFNKILWLEHRLIFYIFYKYLPEFIDHIDGDRLNNSIENLREATRSENNRNSRIKKNNSSGVKGVSWCSDIKKWRVRCRYLNKEHSFGLFDDLELAELVSIEVRNLYHGSFARHK